MVRQQCKGKNGIITDCCMKTELLDIFFSSLTRNDLSVTGRIARSNLCLPSLFYSISSSQNIDNQVSSASYNAIGVHICEHGSKWMDCQGS